MERAVQVTLAVVLLSVFSIVIGAQVAGLAHSQEKAQPRKPSPVQEARPVNEQAVFMRRKLDASNQILEGLLTEDSNLIRKGASSLMEMSKAEQWQVRNDVMYKQFSTEFQQSAKKLLESAEKESFDTAALKWIDTTLKCIDCHKFVRGNRIAAQAK